LNQVSRARGQNSTLSEGLWRALACPHCAAALAANGEGARCSGCAAQYPRGASGALDLRLQRAKAVRHEFTLGTPLAAARHPFAALPPHPRPQVDFAGRDVPYRLSRELMSHFPRAQQPGELMLDLGCGRAAHRGVCEAAGFEYVGLDHDSGDATLLGDAHALPFRDRSIACVLSMAVLEHLRFPVVALREVRRVLRPGALFLGTVAFLEPFHEDSYYHHTHLGLCSHLQEAGFAIDYVCPADQWSGLLPMAQMALFPRMPAPLVKTLLAPLVLLHRAWWALGARVDARASEELRVLSMAGAFSFVARAEGA
jgi:SAM-dependent methyltransferase